MKVNKLLYIHVHLFVRMNPCNYTLFYSKTDTDFDRYYRVLVLIDNTPYWVYAEGKFFYNRWRFPHLRINLTQSRLPGGKVYLYMGTWGKTSLQQCTRLSGGGGTCNTIFFHLIGLVIHSFLILFVKCLLIYSCFKSYFLCLSF